MKKIIGLISVVLSVSMAAQADTWVANTAKNQRGEEVRADYGGYDATRIYSTNETVVCTGRCVLAGVLPSTGAAGTIVYFYDTSVTGALAAAELKYYTNFDASATGTAQIRAGHKPMRFSKGVSVKLASVSAGESVTVLTVDLDQR